MTNFLCEVEHRRRTRIAEEELARGGNLTSYAATAGISLKAAFGFLRTHHPELHRRLAMGPRGRQVSGHQALVRLLLIKSVAEFRGGRARLAGALGLTRAALSAFERTWAPDGLDAAIDDLMPEELDHG